MSIEDDVVLLERVPTLRLLGMTALRMLAIGSEQRDFAQGDVLFKAGDDADAGYIVQRGAFLRRQFVDRLLVQIVLPLPGVVVHPDNAEQRRFSSS